MSLKYIPIFLPSKQHVIFPYLPVSSTKKSTHSPLKKSTKNNIHRNQPESSKILQIASWGGVSLDPLKAEPPKLRCLGLHFDRSSQDYLGVSKNRGFSPQIIHSFIGFSIICTKSILGFSHHFRSSTHLEPLGIHHPSLESIVDPASFSESELLASGPSNTPED